jgi:hypothetical protein
MYKMSVSKYFYVSIYSIDMYVIYVSKHHHHHEGDEFARASPPPIKQEYVGTVGVNGTVDPGVKKAPTAGADPNWTAKGTD